MTETLAKEWGALVVFGEHRYFGGSWPFNSKTKAMDGANKQFLTVDNVLMDYNELIKSIKMEYNAQDKAVIAFGGSYGGMLAAWMRMKYPQTIQGALAASAPILYFKGAENMHNNGASFFDVITNDFATVLEPAGGLCAEGVKQAFLEIPKLMAADNSTWAALKADYNLCDDVTSAQDLQDLYDHT
jgi:pimeloyl-ACP methyl ester carboxylesterase